MGGLGSGHWERKNRRNAVAECFAIRVQDLLNDRELVRDVAGVNRWTDQSGSLWLEVSFLAVRNDVRGARLYLAYFPPGCHEKRDEVVLPISLQQTRPYFGGVRYWFTCPIVADGVPCLRRVAKLFLPLGARYFACRHCHELIYRTEPDPLERADAHIEVLRKRLERIMSAQLWAADAGEHHPG